MAAPPCAGLPRSCEAPPDECGHQPREGAALGPEFLDGSKAGAKDESALRGVDLCDVVQAQNDVPLAEPAAREEHRSVCAYFVDDADDAVVVLHEKVLELAIELVRLDAGSASRTEPAADVRAERPPVNRSQVRGQGPLTIPGARHVTVDTASGVARARWRRHPISRAAGTHLRAPGVAPAGKMESAPDCPAPSRRRACRCKARQDEGVWMDRCIVCAIDDTDHGLTVARVAARLSRELDVRVVLVHVAPARVPLVVPAPAALPSPLYAEQAPPAEMHRPRVPADDAAYDLLERTAQAEVLIGAELRPERGDPAARILAVADDEAAEFVVLGSGRKGSLATMLLGSVSHEVVSRAACPVVVVPEGVHVSAPWALESLSVR